MILAPRKYSDHWKSKLNNTFIPVGDKGSCSSLLMWHELLILKYEDELFLPFHLWLDYRDTLFLPVELELYTYVHS